MVRGHSRRLVCRHRHSTWGFSHLHPVSIRWHQVASRNPFCSRFLRHSHLNPVLVNTLYHSSVTFVWPWTYHNWLSDLELLVLTTVSLVKSWLYVRLLSKLLHTLRSLCQHCTIVGFFYCDTRCLVQLLIEKEHKIFVNMLNHTS